MNCKRFALSKEKQSCFACATCAMPYMNEIETANDEQLSLKESFDDCYHIESNRFCTSKEEALSLQVKTVHFLF